MAVFMALELDTRSSIIPCDHEFDAGLDLGDDFSSPSATGDNAEDNQLRR
jgi:hypothetical protein